jgi:glycerol-1-phosphate dehydrogenase [NAD(P)+]
MTHHTFNGKLQSHGFQVAIGTLTMCAFFDAFLEMDLRNLDIDKCVEAWPSLEEEQQRALDIFKDFVSPDLGYKQITIKYNDKETVRQQLTMFKKHWPLLKAQYRKQVYPFEKMQECFRKVGAPADPSDIGVTRQQLKDMMPFVQMMRWRMNLLDLARRGGFYDELVEKVFGKGGAWEIA